MKIVHVIDYFQPQLGYQETYLALEHQAAGHDVHVVTSDRYAPVVRNVLSEGCPSEANDSNYEFKVHRLKPIGEYRTRVWLRDLESRICSLKPDLIIVHGIISVTTVRVAILKQKLPGTKVVIDCHANYINSRHRLRKQFYALYRYFILPIIQANADAIVAVDGNSKKFLIHECGFTQNPIHVIPLGADINLFHFDPAARAQTRSRLGMAPDEIVCVFSGKISRVKDVHVFIQAGLNVLRDDSRVRMLIIGDGDRAYIEEMKIMVREAGHENKVFWTGFISSRELSTYYSASDIAVWPKQVSISTLEAQSCGLPLIVANTPMLRDRVGFGNGLVFEANSVGSLEQKIRILINDEAYRKQLGDAGRKAVERYFNWKVIAHNFIELVN